MEAAKHKEERISIRLSADQKLLIDRAAQALGLSISSFILSNAVEAANQVAGQQYIELSERDWDRFMEIISLDAEPAPAAVRTAERYKKGLRLERVDG